MQLYGELIRVKMFPQGGFLRGEDNTMAASPLFFNCRHLPHYFSFTAQPSAVVKLRVTFICPSTCRPN